ncbi:hypothetical protein [Glutamicibacter sp. NPDC127525]|uniref:hypothetical protein n=1 Tax=unclassified Glutamicibacter TaxID=2627139 RepID=UPI00363E7705
MKNKFVNASIAAVLTCGLTFTALPASASTPAQLNPAATAIAEDSVSNAEVEKLAKDLEALFTHGITQNEDGSFRVDEMSIIEHFGEVEGGQIIAQFRAQVPQTHIGNIPVASAANYGQCVLNFTGFATLFGASEGTILGYLNRKDWKKAAETMVKFLGKQAIKGGVVGLAASLAAAGAWCATPWGK